MSASPLVRGLAAYRPADDDERRDLERLLHLARSPAPFDRTSPLHITGSAFVVDPPRRRLLLRFHPRHDRWLQVGGHGDPFEHDPFAVALREATEETGLDDLVPFPAAAQLAIVQVSIVEVGASGDEAAHEHGDLRYVLSTARPQDARAESDDAPLRWSVVEDALAEPLDPGLLRGIARVAALLGDRPAPGID